MRSGPADCFRRPSSSRVTSGHSTFVAAVPDVSARRGPLMRFLVVRRTIGGVATARLAQMRMALIWAWSEWHPLPALDLELLREGRNEHKNEHNRSECTKNMESSKAIHSGLCETIVRGKISGNSEYLSAKQYH